MALATHGCRHDVAVHLMQQLCGCFDVAALPAFSEPGNDPGQYLLRFSGLAVVLPPAAQAHRCAEFKRAHLLLTSDGERLPKTFLDLQRGSILQRTQFPLQPI